MNNTFIIEELKQNNKKHKILKVNIDLSMYSDVNSATIFNKQISELIGCKLINAKVEKNIHDLNNSLTLLFEE